MKGLSRWIVLSGPFVFLLCATMPARAQSGTKNGEWRTYGGDLASTRYSPLDQINAENFNKLAVAWRFKTDSLGPRPEFKFESTPLMVHGVLYSTGGTRRAVVALDASTGELLWMLRGSSQVMDWPIGPTARKNESYMSLRAIGSSR
jgi:quinoprotein glucose dehydrogenase